MAIYQLKGNASGDGPVLDSGIPEPDNKMLLSNVHWFISVRWIVVVVFVVSGISGRLFSEHLASFGFTLPVVPLLSMAAFILLLNSGFYMFSRKLSETNHRSIAIILWIQIIIDLVFVTSLVYFIGSTETFIPFIYLIHITLSCIFFPMFRSIIIVIIAALSYLTCVILQNFGVLARRTVLLSQADIGVSDNLVRFLFALSAVLTWFILWYFISTLSEGVRERDSSLRIANLQLKKAEKEKTRQVLITTHDLKAPFAGIETNISVLKYLHWEELPESCKKIIDKIEIRSQTLRERIKQILALGNLRSRIDKEIEIVEVNLKLILDDIIGEISEQILSKKIVLDTDIKEITVKSNEEKLRILFSNLISNAVYYTPDEGRIEIMIIPHKDEVEILIRDTGIGIKEEYLDKIFDEYFRTPEARNFNKKSTGLGLQIVKTVTEQLGLSLSVESIKDKGTTFTVGIKI